MSEDIVLERVFVALICEDYNTMIRGENGNDHIMIETAEHKTYRWKAYPEREKEIMDHFGATNLNDLFAKGADKNDPLIRELYRCMGYSLSGYWEIFYWEVNNEKADEWVG